VTNPSQTNAPRATTSRTIAERVTSRVRAQRWLLDAARRHPRSRQLRAAIERRRSERIVSHAGSIDAALDQIVHRAIREAAADRADHESPDR